MTIFQAAVFGLIQGLTEFLPVSSSAHLILLPYFTGWRDPGLAFDVALHWGTLLGVVIYFRKDLFDLAIGFIGSLEGERNPSNALPWQIGLATVPGAILGFLFEKQAESIFRSPWIIVGTMTVMGVLLFAAERLGKNAITLENLPWGRALSIGVSQGLAIIPGVSRSGSTISMGLFLGLERNAAVRFSFLLSIPIIFGAGLVKIKYVVGNISDPAFLTGMAVSAVSGFLAIHFLITYVRTKSFMPFVIYRLAVAALLALCLLLGIGHPPA